MSIVELSVHMDCHGCQTKIRKALRKLDGVNDIDIDMSTQKVTVMGYVDQETVLKAVRRTGRRAELWPSGYNPEYTSFNQQNYYYQQQPAYLLESPPPPAVVGLDQRPLSEIYSSSLPSAPPEPYDDDGQYSNVDYQGREYSNVDYQGRKYGWTSNYDDEDGYYRDYQRRCPGYSAVNYQPATSLFSDENPHACCMM